MKRHPLSLQTPECSWRGPPPPSMKMPWRYRADGAWSSPPPGPETVTASRGSWPVLRNRKRTHVPGLVRLDKGQTRYGEAIGHRYAALPDSYRRDLICPAQRGIGHIQTGVSGCAKRPRPLPAERKADRRGWSSQKPVAPAPPTGFSRWGGRIFTINLHGEGRHPQR